MKLKRVVTNKNGTIALAKKLAKTLLRHDIVALTGDLGAGKTTFTASVAKSLGVKEKVISPTFNILKCYFDGKIPFYHIDAYRLKEHNKEIGLEEYIEGDGVAFIEWPNYIKELLNIPHLEINIKNLGGNKREIIFTAPNQYYAKKLGLLK